VDRFQQVLIQTWKTGFNGSPLFNLTKKLFALKLALKQWRKATFQDPKANIKAIREKLAEVHHQLSSDPSNIRLQKEEISLQEQLGDWLAREESQWRQKSREDWLHLGDKNTRFFYSAARVRQFKNHIAQLICPTGESVSNTASLKAMAPAFYKKLFNQEHYWNVFPRVVVKKKLTLQAS